MSIVISFTFIIFFMGIALTHFGYTDGFSHFSLVLTVSFLMPLLSALMSYEASGKRKFFIFSLFAVMGALNLSYTEFPKLVIDCNARNGIDIICKFGISGLAVLYIAVSTVIYLVGFEQQAKQNKVNNDIKSERDKYKKEKEDNAQLLKEAKQKIERLSNEIDTYKKLTEENKELLKKMKQENE